MPDDNLVKYIRDGLAMGRTEDVLRPLLLNAGWAEKDVDEAFAFVKGQAQAGASGQQQVQQNSQNLEPNNVPPASSVSLRSQKTSHRSILKKKKIALVSLYIFLAMTVLGLILLAGLEQNPSTFKLFGFIYAIVWLWFVGYGIAYIFSCLAAKVYGGAFFTFLMFWIGGAVFLVWATPTILTVLSYQAQINDLVQGGASPKTAEAIQGIQYLVQQFGRTLLNAKPITQTLHPVSATVSTTFSFQGVTFRMPWTGISKNGNKGNPTVIVSKTFTNGERFVFIPSPTNATDTRAFASMSSTLDTAYAIENAALNATPDQVISSTPGNQAVLTFTLLLRKTILLNVGGPPIYHFDTGFVRGFQYGDASLTRPVSIGIFDQEGTEYTLGMTGTQGEVDYVLASMRPEQ